MMMDTNLILICATGLNTVVLLVIAFVVFRILQSERAQQADLVALLKAHQANVPALLAAKPPDAATASPGAVQPAGMIRADLEPALPATAPPPTLTVTDESGHRWQYVKQA